MPTPTPQSAAPKFCSDCGTQFNAGASFCHMCGSAVPGRGAPAAGRGTPIAPGGAPAPSNTLRWGVPVIAFLVLVVLTAIQFASRSEPVAGGTPLGGGAMRAPDISSMSPQERADRLFNRVMLLTSEGKRDSAAFFAPMAMGAIEALAPLGAHLRYDLGLVSLVAGDATIATAQADTILAERPNHLLGLVLAAQAADARGDAASAAEHRRRLRSAEAAERAAGLQEYTDHDADIRAALISAP